MFIMKYEEELSKMRETMKKEIDKKMKDFASIQKEEMKKGRRRE